ncbi:MULTISPECIES: RNA polymerase sigma factor [Streptomyces]|uniref:RNA polymerase sigma factor n=1 Tax=Streptomyces TaxID=1883 RepID=UPI000B5030A0|nr:MULTISPECIES: sigma-70 family RNA polymerase sigma factor [unclassified Streptomyces]MYW99898.1 sigma-70 family RNA polymerase sigma factor [Streptomyces sp. SID8378]SNB89863.1 RNA polymerase sigma-70 factor, ECF subfamily [Streptomyces sp. PgraA7]
MASAGDSMARAEKFDEFFLRWEPQVRRYLLWLEGDHAVIEDAAQETMLAAHTYWDFVNDLRKPQAWLFKVAGQRLQRVQASRQRHGLATDPGDLPQSEGPDDLGLRERELVLFEAVRKLPDRQRAAIALRWQLDLPNDEIAAVMGVSVNTVKTLLRLGRGTLETVLADVSGGER